MAGEVRAVDAEVREEEVSGSAEREEGRKCVHCRSTNLVEENHEGQELLVSWH